MALELITFKQLGDSLAVVDAGFDQLNAGGLNELFIILPDDITTLPSYNPTWDASAKFEIPGASNIVLAANSEVWALRFTTDTGGYQEMERNPDAGTHWEQLIKVDIPKQRPEIAWLKWRMQNRRYVAVFRDNNGLVRILGTKEKGMQWSWSSDTKTAWGDTNGHTLTGKLNALTPAVFWDISGDITQSITIS